jgi:PAS domain S-box-containing protein
MRNKFFLNIIVPAILTIVLFVFAFSFIFLPMFEKNMMEVKKEMIKELTNSAWSILEEYYRAAKNEDLTEKEAKNLAIKRIQHIRYGDEGKDYFWLTNMEPMMIMHPYRPELNESDLSDYSDPMGTKLFVEAVKKVKNKGEGYIHYQWQWKDDSSRIVPKLSFVKEFKPWGWIIGTGIYLEDVKKEISAIEGRLVRITVLIVFLIAVIVIYITRQSLIIERRRIDAERELKKAKQKYKMLVEASTESTLMLLNNRIIYFNQWVLHQTGYSDKELRAKTPDELFVLKSNSMTNLLEKIDDTRNIEVLLKTKAGKKVEAVLTISSVNIYDQHGFIIIIKEVTRQLKRERSGRILEDHKQSMMLLMNASIKRFIREHQTIDMDATLYEAAQILIRKKTHCLFVTKNHDIIGLIDHNTFLAGVVSGKNISEIKAFEIMHSPVIYTDKKSTLLEAMHQMLRVDANCLAVKNQYNELEGLITKNDILEVQQDASVFLIHEVENAELIHELQSLYDKLPGIVSLFLESGVYAEHIMQICTAISDAIMRRVVELAIEKTGPPPAAFSFFTLGSEGREEQTLKTDQDNAIAYKGQETKEKNRYFTDLAARINEWLHNIGYEYCKGEIMANNPKWCQPLSIWKMYFRQWIEDSDPESILDTSIFFDLRHIYGDPSIIEQLKGEMFSLTNAKSVFFYHLAQSVQRFKPVSYSDKMETIDLKKAVALVVGFARLYALQHKIEATNTMIRISNLIELERINRDFGESVLQAYRYLMELRFRVQSENILSNAIPDNVFPVDNLSHIEKAKLKAALSEISEIPTQIGFDYKQYA